MICLSPIIRNYLKLKLALGRGYVEEERVLRSLNQFLSKKKAVDLTSNNFELWSNTLAHLTPTVRRNRMRIVRNFCIYRSRKEPGCFVPDKQMFVFGKLNVVRVAIENGATHRKVWRPDRTRDGYA
jgi:hypothetical protein